jgi:hypothetical protein
MKKTMLFLIVVGVFQYSQAQNIPSSEIQIKTAVMAAPEDMRDGAKVYGYDEQGEWKVLREGSNEMVCIADDPTKSGFNVSCYHQDLEPFMERGRELTKEGKSFQEIFDTREKEVKDGKLKMPKDGVTLFVLSADDEDFDTTTGEVKNSNFRYVVYIPYATVESTGLPLKPEAPGMPWIMDPGTHRAHIMITPPPRGKN